MLRRLRSRTPSYPQGGPRSARPTSTDPRALQSTARGTRAAVRALPSKSLVNTSTWPLRKAATGHGAYVQKLQAGEGSQASRLHSQGIQASSKEGHGARGRRRTEHQNGATSSRGGHLHWHADLRRQAHQGREQADPEGRRSDQPWPASCLLEERGRRRVPRPWCHRVLASPRTWSWRRRRSR